MQKEHFAERNALIIELHNAGMTASQIVQKVGHGLTRNAVLGAVHRWRKTHGALPARAKCSRIIKAPHKAAPRAQSAKKPKSLPDASIEPQDPPLYVHLMDLDAGACHWPVGMREGTHAFCGLPRGDSPRYCAHHRQLAYRRVLPGQEPESARTCAASSLTALTRA